MRPGAADLEIDLLLEAIYRKYHYDFRRYSRASIRRRLADAMVAFDCQTLSRLQERVVHDETVFPDLMRFLTVQVSDLFREPEFFRTFRGAIVPLLKTYPSLRLWIAGCSTGEEAYSFAILLHEEGLLDNAIVYATDINAESLRVAEAGLYRAERLEKFTENHRMSGAKNALSEYYTAAYGSVVFNRSLRKSIVFSDHSLATDGCFAEMQVISCRNVLIYFDQVLQNRALGLLSDSLCRRGFVGLGARETMRFTEHDPNFAEVGDRWYQRC